MNKKLPYVSHEDAQLQEYREHPARALDYLNACIQVAFDEDDPELVLTALALVAKAFGMARVAKAADLKRESLHRMLSRRGNPEWRSIFKVFRALHVRPVLEPESVRVSEHRTASLVSDHTYEKRGAVIKSGRLVPDVEHQQKGLNRRMRDARGEIRRKRGDTKIETLRREYGQDFAAGYRADAKLGTVLKNKKTDSLGRLHKKKH